MFAPRFISHANKITSFHCLLSKMPLSAKKYECGSGLRLFIAGTFRSRYCESLVIVNHFGLREPRARIKLQGDVFFVIVTLEGCKPDRVH